MSKSKRFGKSFLREMLAEFNEGRSKSFYCIAATVLEIPEMEGVLAEARQKSTGIEIKEKALLMHSLLDKLAAEKGYVLKMRK